MTENLFAAVADPAQIVQITRDELLGRLGWRERVEFRSRHEFPVDESFYEPITETLDEFGRDSETLKVAISEFSEAQDQGSQRSLLSAFELALNV